MKTFKILPSITDRQDESLKIFFKEISKIPLLTQEEEKKLAYRMKNGDKDAIDKMVASNLRFVVSVAKQYQNKGLPLIDLIQEGCTGIIRACESYDVDTGNKFISYAVWWIRQAILQAISDQCRTVRVPVNHIVTMNKINKMVEKFEQENGRFPSNEEIEEETKLPIDKINFTLSSSYRTTSLDSSFKDDEDASLLIDILPNTNIEDSDERIEYQEDYKELLNILSNLSDREHDIVVMYFGIGMFPMQYEEIANRFGIGSERVRQILHEALEYLRKNYSNELKQLL